MKKFLKENYLFLILFLLFLLKDPLYKMFTIKDNVYTPTKCAIIESDYNKLLEFSNINVIYESDYINTYIIYKDIYNYLNEITIRGGKDLELKDNPVIYDNTLVGVISKVDKNTSKVRLLTNKDSKISVKIKDQVGIIEYEDGKLIVRNIPKDNSIQIGDDIYTSGIGKIKENIYIGTVKNITLDRKNIEVKIEVSYQLKIKDLLYVTVMKESI